MKTLFTTLIATLLFAPMTFAQTNGRIKVTVLDEMLQPIPGAVVTLIGGGPLTGGATDLDGIFTFVNLNPGAYDVQARVTSYKRYVKNGIQVSAGQTAYVTYNMVPETDTLPITEILEYRSPVDPTFSTVQSISADQIKRAAGPRGDIGQMITGYSTQVSVGEGGQLVMRGAREGASAIYIDGEKMYGSSGVPALGIAQVSVLSGGIPAEYGDLSGGAVIITTHTFYTGMAAQERMYENAALEVAADSAAADAKSGKRIESDKEVIENQQPQGQQQPAPAEDPQPQPQGDQPKEAEQPK
jgi:hypothetical protein